MADLEDALEFGIERVAIPEPIFAPRDRMSRGRVEAALARAAGFCRNSHDVRDADQPNSFNALVKRLACERSALARVSNQSAISSKPSSRAVLAMPGYMSVYSCVAPAMAAFRLLLVVPIGRPVAGSPAASRCSRCPCAWPVSPSAVERNTAATSL